MTDGAYILISGATSDIGREIARTLSGRYALLLHGRDRAKLESLKAELCSPNAVELWTADLQAPEEVSSSLKAFLAEKQIQVSGFVHCAGALRLVGIKNAKAAYYNEVFNVNLFSAIEIIRILLSKTNGKTLSNIIFISAMSSIRADIGNSLYAASKGAINSLTTSLAFELAPVRVNAILPGAIKTEMTKHLFAPEISESIGKRYALKPGAGSDIADMVEFLLSEKSRWITGQQLSVDGGASAF